MNVFYTNYYTFSFPIRRNSTATIPNDTIAAIKSAIGPAYIIPSIPMNNGKITMSGSKNKICLVRDKKIPFFGLPIAVKKVDVIG